MKQTEWKINDMPKLESMSSQKQFLRFEEQSPIDLRTKPKTKIWRIFSTHSGDLLGFVHWENGWRQYVSTSPSNIIWSVGCLRQLADFIEQKNIEHKRLLK